MKNCTIVISTSYLPECHPCTDMIWRIMNSFSKLGLSGEERVIISCDQTSRPQADYHEYVRRLSCFGEVVVQEEHVGAGMVAKAGLEKVNTELVFFCEHDFELIRTISPPIIESIFDCQEIKCLRLNRYPNVVTKWDKNMSPVRVGVPALKTTGWSANPHFARMSWYREFAFPKIKKDKGRGGLETELAPLYLKRQKEVGFDKAFEEFGACIYGKLGDPPMVFHLGGDRIRGRLGKPLCCKA